MRDKKNKKQKTIEVRDLKPRKDAKGGFRPQSPGGGHQITGPGGGHQITGPHQQQ